MSIATARHLELEIRRLRAENSRLRAALRQNSRHAQRVRRAHDAAMLLATWHVGFLSTSRRACMERGMAQRQWENGMALLRLARVVTPSGWAVHDLAVIAPALDRAADLAVAEPHRFFARLASHGGTGGARAPP